MHSSEIQPDSPTLRFSPLENEADLDDFFGSVTRVVHAGDAAGTRKIWSLPALLVSEEGTRMLRLEHEVLSVFGEMKELSRGRGAMQLRTEIKRVHWVAESLALVETRWAWLGRDADEVHEDACTWIVRRQAGGGLRLEGVVLHGHRRLFH